MVNSAPNAQFTNDVRRRRPNHHHIYGCLCVFASARALIIGVNLAHTLHRWVGTKEKTKREHSDRTTDGRVTSSLTSYAVERIDGTQKNKKHKNEERIDEGSDHTGRQPHHRRQFWIYKNWDNQDQQQDRFVLPLISKGVSGHWLDWISSESANVQQCKIDSEIDWNKIVTFLPWQISMEIYLFVTSWTRGFACASHSEIHMKTKIKQNFQQQPNMYRTFAIEWWSVVRIYTAAVRCACLLSIYIIALQAFVNGDSAFRHVHHHLYIYFGLYVCVLLLL